jgi:multidrug efflux pump
MSRFFIDRPVFAWVIAILITLGGTLSIFRLAVEAYPEIAPPQISVSASYPGASADVVEKAITTVIEQQLTGLEGLLYFNSSSGATGGSSITLTFENGTDIDIAAVEVQNRVRRAEPRLPQAVRDQGISVAKASAGFLMVVSLVSDGEQVDPAALNNLVSSTLLDQIQRINGVGGANQFGSEFAMRIWLDPGKLQGFGLTAADALAAVRGQNVQFAAGSIGGAPALPGQAIQASISAESRFTTAAEFEQILLRSNSDGSAVQLKDVARVELGASSYDRFSQLDGKPSASFAVQLLPGANALQVASAVKARMAELAQGFPPGVEWVVPFDSSTFVEISIYEVIITLCEAIVLVFLVMLLFLQNLRATLIPMLVVPVALTGAFIGMYLFGFSINVLSLFGLVLAIGIVVDDAIVVVENVERIMTEERLSPREATIKAMGQISGAVIAVTLVLAAVFVPSALMTGSVGAIYQQFALTIALSMLLSAVMALSFTPALCATMLKPVGAVEHQPNRFFRGFNRVFDRTTRGYLSTVSSAVRHLPRWLVVYGALVLAAGWIFTRLPTSFLPEEDQGYAVASIQLPAGATLERTLDVIEQLDSTLKSNPLVVRAIEVAGFSFLGQGENAGLAFIKLKDWDERQGADERIDGFLAWANKAMSGIREAQIFVANLPTIRGLGQFGGFDFRLQDRAGLGRAALLEARATLLAEAQKDPALAGVRANGLDDSPQLKMRADRLQAQTMGVSVGDIYQAIQLMLAPVYVNDFNYLGRVLRVQMQADAPFRMQPQDLGRYYVRGASGQQVPLSNLVTTEWTLGPPSIERYNGIAAFSITGSAAPGYSSGDAMMAMERIVRDKLPTGVGYEWSGQSLQEILSGSQAPMLFALSLLVVFLTLAALYESWSIPVSVLLVVPLGLLGAVLFMWLRGLPNDIYFKVGLIAIIGLSAKNAILIIEFASALQKRGMSAIDATLEACRLRFRPILMTSIAFILGVLPLVISSGAGANSRHAIGTGVMGGMIAATLLGVLLVPVFYVAIRRLLGDRKESSSA